MDKRVIAGFDLREALVDGSASGWTQTRRSEFLIRPDAEGPISVDTLVWRSLLATNNGHPLNLWSSLSDLRSDLGTALTTAGADSAVVIEIAVVEPESAQYWENLLSGYVRAEEEAAGAVAASEIGFDFADRYLISGLSNCGYSAEELLRSGETGWKRLTIGDCSAPPTMPRPSRAYAIGAPPNTLPSTPIECARSASAEGGEGARADQNVDNARGYDSELSDELWRGMRRE